MFAIRKLIVSLLLPLVMSVTAFAAGRTESGQKHMLRLGWGDMMYEHIAYSPSPKHVFDDVASLPEGYRVRESYGHKYFGHFFAEYQYRLIDCLSVGAQFDFGSFRWQNGIFNRNHALVEQLPNTSYSNLSLMPTARVTYFEKGPVSMYSGLGAGLMLCVSENTEAAFAFNINLIGVQAGYGHWSGALELGMMNATAGMNRVFLFGSRLVSLSINYAW